jgi:hypothetical protein
MLCILPLDYQWPIHIYDLGLDMINPVVLSPATAQSLEPSGPAVCRPALGGAAVGGAASHHAFLLAGIVFSAFHLLPLAWINLRSSSLQIRFHHTHWPLYHLRHPIQLN